MLVGVEALESVGVGPSESPVGDAVSVLEASVFAGLEQGPSVVGVLEVSVDGGPEALGSGGESSEGVEVLVLVGEASGPSADGVGVALGSSCGVESELELEVALDSGVVEDVELGEVSPPRGP